MEDWSNFGIDYYKTLMAWHQRVEEHRNKLQEAYSNRFYRMWKYYLLCSAGSFLARKNHQWQIVLTPSGRSEGFERPALPFFDK
jgi:cyclopropane-fatty-acyl-phospholipid synthase